MRRAAGASGRGGPGPGSAPSAASTTTSAISASHPGRSAGRAPGAARPRTVGSCSGVGNRVLSSLSSARSVQWYVLGWTSARHPHAEGSTSQPPFIHQPGRCTPTRPAGRRRHRRPRRGQQEGRQDDAGDVAANAADGVVARRCHPGPHACPGHNTDTCRVPPGASNLQGAPRTGSQRGACCGPPAGLPGRPCRPYRDRRPRSVGGNGRTTSGIRCSRPSVRQTATAQAAPPSPGPRSAHPSGPATSHTSSAIEGW